VLQLWGATTEVMTYNTSHIGIKNMKCSESLTLLQIEFRIQLQSFQWKIENKTHLQKR
jgi:hypothetical protein